MSYKVFRQLSIVTLLSCTWWASANENEVKNNEKMSENQSQKTDKSIELVENSAENQHLKSEKVKEIVISATKTAREKKGSSGFSVGTCELKYDLSGL